MERRHFLKLAFGFAAGAAALAAGAEAEAAPLTPQPLTDGRRRRKQRCATGGHHRRRGRSSCARTGALGPRSRQGMGQAALGPPPLGLAPPPSLGLASPPLAPLAPSLLAPPLLVSAIDLIRGRAGFPSSRFRVDDGLPDAAGPPTKNPARAGFLP